MKTLNKMFTVATMGAMLAVGGQSHAQNTTLSVVGSWAGLELHRRFENPYWSQTLPGADAGIRVQLTTHDQMGVPGGDVYKLLSQGLFDVAMTVADYAVSDAPEIEALDMPMLSLTVADARRLAEAYMPIAEHGFNRRFNSKVLAIVPYPQQIVFCRTPVTNLDDLRGKSIRASGRTTLEFLEAAGARALNIAFNEVPGALDRGVIDCAVTGSMSGYSSAWYEMAGYLYTLPAGGWDYVVTAISNDKWNSLSAAQRATIERTIQTDFIDQVWANAEVDTQQGIACLTGQGTCERGTAQSMTLVTPTQADLDRSRQILEQTVLPNWARRVDDSVVAMWNERVGSLVGLTASK